VPFKLKHHVSIYLDEKLQQQVADIAVAEKKSLNKTINELIRTGLARRHEEILGLEQIAKSVKADLQLQRDEIRRQSNRIATVLSRIGLHAIAGRYQTTHLHAHLSSGEKAKDIANKGWTYALEKLKEKVDKDNDTKE